MDTDADANADNGSLLRMDSRTWALQVHALAGNASILDPRDEALMLRQAHALFAIAPLEHARRFNHLPDLARVDALLGAGAPESVALALLPPNAAYIVSRGNNGVNLASVLLDGDDEEVAAEAATVALAVLAAFAGALRFAAPMSRNWGELERTTPGVQASCLH